MHLSPFILPQSGKRGLDEESGTLLISFTRNKNLESVHQVSEFYLNADTICHYFIFLIPDGN